MKIRKRKLYDSGEKMGGKKVTMFSSYWFTGESPLLCWATKDYHKSLHSSVKSPKDPNYWGKNKKHKN